MRVAIDTRSLLWPFTGVGRFVHRLTSAMLPLLAADEQLLSFTGWRVEPLDREFLARAEMRNSGSDPQGLSRRSLMHPQWHFARDLIGGFRSRRYHPLRCARS